MFSKFPSIKQFKDVIKQVKEQTQFKGLDAEGNPIMDRYATLPTLSFTGTVKLHGTNAAVVKNEDGSIHFQSRERIITPESDNAGFALFASTIDWEPFLSQFDASRVEVFGEWCGGNIQKGVALNQLPKMFVIFKVRVDGFWLKELDTIGLPTNERILCIIDAPKFYVDIDFNNPQATQNFLVEKTLEVEAECPFAKMFGVSGTGEGIVWTCDADPTLTFKTKGEKHSASKVKTIAAVDTEALANMREFIDSVVTINRLAQGLNYLEAAGKEVSLASTGDFIRWVYNDILREEADVIVASGLEVKAIGRLVAERARPWFMEVATRA